jgi:hypothetical protein
LSSIRPESSVRPASYRRSRTDSANGVLSAGSEKAISERGYELFVTTLESVSTFKAN